MDSVESMAAIDSPAQARLQSMLGTFMQHIRSMLCNASIDCPLHNTAEQQPVTLMRDVLPVPGGPCNSRPCRKGLLLQLCSMLVAGLMAAPAPAQ